MKRNFVARSPNELWLTDITEHPTREGKVYCCAVLDLFTARSLGGRSTAPVKRRS